MFWTWKTFRFQPFPFILEFYVLSGKKAFEKTPVNFLSIISAAPSHDFCKKNMYIYPGSPVDQTIRGLFFLDDSCQGFPILLMGPSRLVDLDFVGVSKNNGTPQIIHFNRGFHYFHHPFWGFSPNFWKHPCGYKQKNIVPSQCVLRFRPGRQQSLSDILVAYNRFPDSFGELS